MAVVMLFMFMPIVPDVIGVDMVLMSWPGMLLCAKAKPPMVAVNRIVIVFFIVITSAHTVEELCKNRVKAVLMGKDQNCSADGACFLWDKEVWINASSTSDYRSVCV